MNMSTQEPEPGLDRQIALLRVDGDVELLKEIAIIFLEDYPKVLAEIRAAIADGDAKQLEASAHTLKGSVANFGAAAVVASALRLELMGRAALLERSSEVLRALEAGLCALHAELEAL
jgi:HPt (histidine-containing phosphotransfer) domain-containing protein